MVQVYTDVKQLRYGHLMIMTDQDHDGSHIKGLIMNYFHTFYPSLMKLPGFLIEFITPVIKVSRLLAIYSHANIILCVAAALLMHWAAFVLLLTCSPAFITVCSRRYGCALSLTMPWGGVCINFVAWLGMSTPGIMCLHV